MLTTASRTRRTSTAATVLALLFGLLMLASPTQAAIGVTLTAPEATVEVGDPFTLNWTSTDAVTLVAGGSWSGNKAIPAGSEVITPTTAGPFTYTLLATDTDGRTESAEVTVNVTAAPVEVTPNPVTFPDECTVVVPTTVGIQYSVTIDGDTETIEAGTYPGLEFFPEDDDEVVFTATAEAGFVIAAGATTTWTYEPSEACLSGETLVTARASCSAVTFTNVTDGPVFLQYGSFEEEEADGEFTLAAGAARKVSTSRPDLGFVALTGDINAPDAFQIDEIAVPQNCGADASDPNPSVSWSNKKPAAHPTSAPAAGVVGDEGGSPFPAIALLGALAAIAVRRSYTLGR